MVMLTERLDMIIVVDWDIKPQNKQTNNKPNMRFSLNKDILYNNNNCYYQFNNDSWFPDEGLENAENYCREPMAGLFKPWCYTLDKKKVYEYCTVPLCNSTYLPYFYRKPLCNRTCMYLPTLHRRPLCK